MKAQVTLELADHQSEVRLPDAWLRALQQASSAAWSDVIKVARQDGFCYDGDQIDVAFVSSADSDRAHQQFMGIAGATDVITFLHGELVICPQVAVAQAAEFGEPLLRELLRYLIHGLLHLAGYTDEQESERQQMEREQEIIVQRVWSEFSMDEIAK